MITNHKSDFVSHKIVGIEVAAKKIAEIKKSKKIGLCHGGFDLLHPGHVKHLESARNLCDFLVVSITSDEFTTKRKGDGRPIFSENLRAYLVANLMSVDLVVISPYERATEVLTKLKPDFYIKGPDYDGKTTPGILAEKNAIELLSGRILYTNDEKFSTTEIVEHIIKTARRRNILLCLDRDGTLIKKVHYLGSKNDWQKQVELRREVVDSILYLKTKFNLTIIVVSNQQGVALGLFDEHRVIEINNIIDSQLKALNITVEAWQFCPEVDKSFANDGKHLKRYIREESSRKPSTKMVKEALQILGRKLDDFDNILVFGDGDDDKMLAQNLSAQFVDVENMDFEEIKKQIDSISF